MTTIHLHIERLLPWIEYTYSRSPGPGGQNVNKVNTRVTLFFDVDGCEIFTSTQKRDLRQKLKTRMTRDGRIRVVRHRYRMQGRNRKAAELELIDLLQHALQKRKVRRATRPSLRSKERRLTQKRQHSLLKKQRRCSTDD